MSKKNLCIAWFILIICFTTFQQIKYHFSTIDNTIALNQKQTEAIITLKDGKVLVFNKNLPKILRKENLSLNLDFNMLTVLIGMYVGIITLLLNFILGYVLYINNVKFVNKESEFQIPETTPEEIN